MDDPDLRSDETILVRTPGIHVKSIPFEGILTNKRIFLVDRAKNLLPPKEILLATIKDVAAGENAIRDQTLTISIIAKSGETRQMVLTFSRQAGGNRIRERDEWVRYLKDRTTSSFEQVIRKVVPGRDAYDSRADDVPAPRIEVVNSPVQQPRPAARQPAKKEVENVQPMRRIVGTSPQHASIPITTREAEQPEPAPAETGVPAFGLFCSRCGNRLMEGSAFCNRCGYQVARQAPPSSPSVQAPAGAAGTSPAVSVPVDDFRFDETPEERPMRIASDPIREAMEEGGRGEPGLRAPVREPAGQKKAGRASFFSRIFGKKERKAAAPGSKSRPAPPAEPPKKARSTRRGFLPGKRTILLSVGILAAIVLVVVGAVFVYPMISRGLPSLPGVPGNNTGGSPSATTTSGANTVSASNTFVIPPAASLSNVPVTGVYVHINYTGSWLGTYGMPSDPQKTADSVDKLYEVLNATGTVQASVAKRDSTTKHALIVEIYKNGKLLTSGNTSAAFGSVTLSADVTTGIAQPAKTGGGTPPTVAPVRTTVKPTIIVPSAAKTTSPTTKATTAAK